MNRTNVIQSNIATKRVPEALPVSPSQARPMACVEHVDIQLGNSVASHLQSISESTKRMASMTTNALPVAEAPIYAKLQRQIHYALRAQHPEWVQPDGNSPICDAYESRLAELLRILPQAPAEVQLRTEQVESPGTFAARSVQPVDCISTKDRT